MIKGILLKIGLNTLPHDPCLLSGVLANPSSPDTISAIQFQPHVSLSVDDFVFYSSDPTQESLFKTLLQEHIQVYLMGDVDYFLGTALTWLKHKYGNISIHMCQSAFTEFTAHWLLFHTSNKVPNMTPYRSGFPINSILPVDPPWSRSSTSNTVLSEFFWLHQLAGNLQSPWNCPCAHLSCLVQKWSPPTTLQGHIPCSQIPNVYEWIWHILSLTVLGYNPYILPLPPSSW